MKPLDRKFLYWIGYILLFILLPIVLKAQTNQTVSSGTTITGINFPASPCTYQWTNDKPSIGLATSGTGNIGSFTAVNNTNLPITATITPIPNFATLGQEYAYITNTYSQSVSVINTTTRAVVATIPVGRAPKGITISRDGSRVFVTNGGDFSVSVINTATNTVSFSIPNVSLSPEMIAVTPDGQYIYVGAVQLNQFWKINTTTLVKNQIISGTGIQTGPQAVVISPDGSKLYVVNYNNATVSVFSTSTDALLATIPTAADPYFAAISADGNYLYTTHMLTGNVSIVNLLTNTLQAIVPVGVFPSGVVGSLDGSKIYVANNRSNTISVINTATNTVINTFAAGDAPYGLSISRDGNLLYVNNATSPGTVSVVNLSNFAILSTIAVGTIPYGIGNFISPGCAIPKTFTITVNAAVPAVITTTGTPLSVNTSYGTPSSSSSFMVSGSDISSGILVTPPPGFEVSLDGNNYTNTVTVGGTGTIASTKVYIRLKQTTAAGTYSGNIVLSSAGASSVNVTMPTSTVSPLAINVYVYGSKHYGDVINNFVATTSNFNFSVINAGLKNGETVASLDISFTGGNTATDPPGTYNNVIHVANLTGSNGFLPSNYTINYQDGPLTVAPEPLTITANNVTKVFGNTLTNETSSTAFTTTGLQNSEIISSIAITYGNGAAANAAIGTYNGSVVPSAAVGSNGFLASNYAISYVPGTLSVIAAGPFITASAPLQPLTTVYGTPSSSTSFNVSGSNVTAGVLVTAPAGFEVSFDNVTFNNTVTIGSAGTIPSTPVYIRLKQTTFVGSYSGNISIKSAGAADVNQAMPASTVTPAPLLIIASQVIKIYGNVLTSGPGSTFFTANGLKNGETAGTVTINYGTGAAATANVGNYNGSVVPSNVVGGTFAAGNYAITYQSNYLTVSTAPLIVTVDNTNKFYGDVNPVFTVKYVGFVNGDGVAQLTTQPTVVTTATQASPVGQYPITASGGVAANYTFAYVDGVLTINPVPFSPITIPNTFTPNGDGINDTWNITNLNTYPKTTVEILNRYGTRIYFSNNYAAPWDGRYNGARVPEGTYYYIITGVNSKPLTGYVAVLR